MWSTSQNDDEMLKRVPKDLDSDSPYADDLRMKSFIAGARMPQKEVTSVGFDAQLAAMFRKAANFTSFLCEAVGVPF